MLNRFSWKDRKAVILHPDETISAVSPRIYVFTYPRPIPLNLVHCFKTLKPTFMSAITCTLKQPKWFLCYIRARPIPTPTGIMFTSDKLPRPLILGINSESPIPILGKEARCTLKGISLWTYFQLFCTWGWVNYYFFFSKLFCV